MMLKPVQPKGQQDVPLPTLTAVKGRRVKTSPGGDRTFRGLTFVCSLLVPLVMLAIGLDLFLSSWPAVKQFGWGFFWSTEWNPVLQEFGAGSSIFGTLVSTFIAMCIAVPLSLAIALFLVELAPPRVSRTAGTLIELLAAVPSIIFGMWGLFIFAPFMAHYVQPFLGQTLGFLPLFPAGSLRPEWFPERKRLR